MPQPILMTNQLSIIYKQFFDKEVLKGEQKAVFYFEKLNELPTLARGERAIKMELIIKFEKADIPEIIEFLQTANQALHEIT